MWGNHHQSMWVHCGLQYLAQKHNSNLRLRIYGLHLLRVNTSDVKNQPKIHFLAVLSLSIFHVTYPDACQYHPPPIIPPLRLHNMCTSIQRRPTFEVLSCDQIIILDKILDRLTSV